MKTKMMILLGIGTLATGILLAGCGEDSGKKAGSSIDRATTATKDATKTAVDATKDATKTAVEATKDASKATVKKTGEVMESTGSAIEKAGEKLQK